MNGWTKACSIAGLLILVLSFSNCTKEEASRVLPPTQCDSIPISYSTDLVPLFNTNCNFVGCHASVTSSAGWSWETYAVVREGAVNGPMLRALRGEPGATPMPFMQDPLPDSLIAKIECWVEQGAQDN